MDKPQTSPARSLIFKGRLRLLILVAYVLLGVIYSFATPMLEKNDEESHAWFVHHLATGGGLPIQVPGTPDSPIQREGSQPPLYYAAAALVMRAFDTSDFDTQLQPNAAPTFNPYSPGNKNLLIITPEKRAFNYRNTTLAVFVLRLLGILPGCLTVWFTHAIAYIIVQDRRVALLAMALTAFNPMFVTVTTALGNDGLVIALSSVALYLLIVLALEGITVRRLVITGIVLALASLSKVSGTLLLPISALAIIGHELLAPPAGNRPWARRAGTIVWQGSVLLVLWLAIAGWWYARNLYLYNDLTGTSIMAQMMTPRNIGIAEALTEFNGFKMSFIAMFGQFAVPADDIVYIGFDAIVVASGLGLIFAAIRSAARRRREPAVARLRWLAVGMLVLYIVLLLASILRWTLMTPASHGRLLFPAIAGISTLMALGLLQLAVLLARRPRAAAAAGAAIALVVTLPLGVVAAVAPFRYIIPAYTPPLLASMPVGVISVTQRFRSLAEIVAYQMTPQEVRPGDRVRVTAILRALGTTPDNYLLVVKLYGRDNVELARFDTFTGGGLLLSSQWRPGDLIKDEVELTVPASAATPAILKVQFELYNRGLGDLVESVDANGQASKPLFAGNTLLPPTAGPATALVTYGSIGALDHFTHTAPVAGQPLTVTLTWHTLQKADKDYTVFVHLLDHDGRLSAQHDGPPDGGNFPTSRWVKGATFGDTHVLDLPADITPGQYTLVTGLYDPSNGERLTAIDAHGREQPNRAYILAALELK